jgi:hypothetical protein
MIPRVTVEPAAIRKLIRAVKLANDPRFLGECKWFREDRRIAKAYFASRGVTVDTLGELLLDRGFITETVPETDILDLLEWVLSAEPKESRVSKSERKAAMSEIELAAERAKGYRQLQFRCDECGAIVRGARTTANGRVNRVACMPCSEAAGNLVEMTRYTQTWSEILNSVDWTAVPF